MAGPCAVESEEQLFETAEIVKKWEPIFFEEELLNLHFPYSFQGLGEKGLEILARAGENLIYP